MKTPVIGIIGRPNVGKSSLFNKIIGKRKSIEDGQPGITRDRIYGDVTWGEAHYAFIDTGGIFFDKDAINMSVLTQVRAAMSESDLILFVVDGREGLHPLDLEITKLLKKSGKKVKLVINKIDNEAREPVAYEFYNLGFPEPILTSASHKIGLSDIEDFIKKELPTGAEDRVPGAIRVTIAGRPNAGKSSILNAVLGSERVIVNEIAGTTRDTIDVLYDDGDNRIIFIDTAGVRKKSKIVNTFEHISLMKTEISIEKSDITLLVLDAAEQISDVDKKIAQMIEAKSRAVIIVVNKWDLVEKEDKIDKKYAEYVRAEIPFLAYAPILFVSALKKLRTAKIITKTAEIYKNFCMKIPTSKINSVLTEVKLQYSPPTRRGRELKLYYISQISAEPPCFYLSVNSYSKVFDNYFKFLEHKFREYFNFEGVPVKLLIKGKK